jgi:sugar phosphate isomerase/epimerase
VTDEVSEELAEALAVSRDWGIDRFELRQGGKGRFPDFTDAEFRRVEAAIREGGEVTAVSPGILKGTVTDTERLDRELERVLPRTIEAARRLDCPRVIVFGLRRSEEPPSDARSRVLRCFERAAEMAAAAGMTVAIENEPGFWVDDPERSARLVEAVGHPSLTLNWDPANLHWGGQRPTRAGFEAIRPHLGNLHVKDYTPDDPDVPWRPVGEGITPWGDLLTWVVEDTELAHVTLETHCTPRIEASRKSLAALRRLLAAERSRS